MVSNALQTVDTALEARRAQSEPLLGNEDIAAYFADKIQLAVKFVERIEYNESRRYGLPASGSTPPMDIIIRDTDITSFTHDVLLIGHLRHALEVLQSAPVSREMEKEMKGDVAEIFREGTEAIGWIRYAAEQLYKASDFSPHGKTALAEDIDTFTRLEADLYKLGEHAVAAFDMMRERTALPEPDAKTRKKEASTNLGRYFESGLWKKAEKLGVALVWNDPEKKSGFIFNTLVADKNWMISPTARNAMELYAREEGIDLTADEAFNIFRSFFQQSTPEMRALKNAMKNGRIERQDQLQDYATLYDSARMVVAVLDRALSEPGSITNHYSQHGTNGAFAEKNLRESGMPGDWSQMEGLALYYREYLDGFAKTMEVQFQNINQVQAKGQGR